MQTTKNLRLLDRNGGYNQNLIVTIFKIFLSATIANVLMFSSAQAKSLNKALTANTKNTLDVFSQGSCVEAYEWNTSNKNKWLKKIKTTQDENFEADAFVFKPKSLSGLKDKSYLKEGGQIEFAPHQSDGEQIGISKIDCKKHVITFWVTDASSDSSHETTFSLIDGKETVGSTKCEHGCD